MNWQKGTAPHINETEYHICTQMEYEKYYAEKDKKTDEFLRKLGDIYLDLNTIFSNWICTLRLKCVYDQVYLVKKYYSMCMSIIFTMHARWNKKHAMFAEIKENKQ